MKTIVFRASLHLAFVMSYFYFLYGQERGHVVPIKRNVAWNDLVTQIRSMPDDSQQESLFKEVLVIRKILNVTDFDIAVFKAIDQVRARFQKVDKDLETIRKELSYEEQETKRGR